MGSDTIPTEYAHIVRTPGVVGGEPHIADHSIRVRDIVAARDLRGYSPEEIAGSVYPRLTLAQVYAALAYYEDHRQEIERASASESEAAAALLEDNPDLGHDCRPANAQGH